MLGEGAERLTWGKDLHEGTRGRRKLWKQKIY